MNLSTAYNQYQGTNELTNATQQTILHEKKRTFRRPYLSDKTPNTTLPKSQPRNWIEVVTQANVDQEHTKRHCWSEIEGYLICIP